MPFYSFFVSNKKLLDILFIGFISIYCAYLIFPAEYLFSIDGYYHFTYSKEMINRGLLRGVSQLPLTILGDNGADPHYLFHLLLIPFAQLKSFLGLRLATFIFLLIPTISIYIILRVYKVPYYWLFILLLLASTPGYVIRMSMLRAQSLAVPMMLLFIIYLAKKRSFPVFFIGLLFSWTYNAHIICYLFSAFAIILFLVKEHKLHIKTSFYSALGLLLGQIIHPQFPNSLNFLYNHVFVTKFNSTELPVIPEWYPSSLNFILTEPLLLNITLLILLLFAIFKFKNLKNETFLTGTAWLIFIPLTIKHGRFMEYWLPISVLFAGLLLRDSIKNSNTKILKIILLTITIFTLSAIPKTTQLSKKLISGNTNNTDKFEKIGSFIEANSKQNDLIMNLYYDDFPFLYYHSPYSRFLTGLNPSFLYQKNPSAYNLLKSLRVGNQNFEGLSNKLYSLFNSCYLISREKNRKYLSENTDLIMIMKTKDGILWRVNAPKCTN